MLDDKKTIEFRSIGNDLFASFFCYCDDDATGRMTQIRLCGYDDANFFDNVNEEPSIVKCRNCEQKYWYQWKRDGVKIVKVGGENEEK